MLDLNHQQMDDNQNQQSGNEVSQQPTSWVQLEYTKTINQDDPTKRSHEEVVYEDLCYVTLRSSNSFSSSTSITHHNDELSLNTLNHSDNFSTQQFASSLSSCLVQNKRDFCWKELVETEKNYCIALAMIIKNFLEPLSKVMSEEHLSQIFNQLKPLALLHQQLYYQLSSTTTSECFVQLRDRFVIYGEYCAKLPRAQQLLDQICQEEEHIKDCVIECQTKVNQGRFKLRDLLSLPMQRILKYHLLLAELIKNTDEKHDDYYRLKCAHDAMLDIGAYINEVKRDTETLDIIRDIQRSIVDLSMPDNYELKDYGRLIKDGEVKMRSLDDQRMRLKNRYIFVFDKVVLMCKILRSTQYSYKEAIILDEYKLEEIPLCSPISKLTGLNKNWSTGWCLVHRRTKQPMYTFYVKNHDDKRKWMEAIERGQENVRPSCALESDHQFGMCTVAPGTSCTSCGKLLKGTWFQGYQCYACNVVVHRSCITKVKSCSEMLHQRTTMVTYQSLNNQDKSCQQQQPTPTPSRNKSRILVKAIAANGHHSLSTTVNGKDQQLLFEPNDTIIVYSTMATTNGEHQSLWYGRNIQTGQEGHFHSSMVTELVTDSPSASSSVDSPSTVTTMTRFSYDDEQLMTNASSIADFSQTLPRKMGNVSNLLLNSPLAASTPQLSSSSVIFNEQPSPTITMTSNQNNQWNGLGQDSQGHLRLYLGNGYNLEEYAWFAGCMDRETAQTTLQPLPNGSFLVRISPKQNNSYAISMNYKGHVKHMRVQVTYGYDVQPTNVMVIEQGSGWPSTTNLNAFSGPERPTHFYLSERRYFRTIVDLVRWYSINSLCESFQMVNTQLLLPYKKAYCHEVLGHAVALYAFTGTSSAASSFLSLRKGDRVTVVSRAAEDKGWWKGQINDRIGYFPFKYVSATTHSLKVYQKQMTSNEPIQQQQNEKPTSPIVNMSGGTDSRESILNNGVNATTLSSPEETGSSSSSSDVNIEDGAAHSRQTSSDAGIEMMTTNGATVH